MKLRWVIVCLLSLASPALADDVSPWFGSEATRAAQIALEKQTQFKPQGNQQAALECPITGCPAPRSNAK